MDSGKTSSLRLIAQVVSGLNHSIARSNLSPSDCSDLHLLQFE